MLLELSLAQGRPEKFWLEALFGLRVENLLFSHQEEMNKKSALADHQSIFIKVASKHSLQKTLNERVDLTSY